MSDDDLLTLEEAACPTCGSCMFTANSMNCLVEALGLAPPGDGSTLATHTARRALYQSAGLIAVDLCRRYYEYGDDRVLPRSIATRAAFENAMTLDIAMGGGVDGRREHRDDDEVPPLPAEIGRRTTPRSCIQLTAFGS